MACHLEVRGDGCPPWLTGTQHQILINDFDKKTACSDAAVCASLVSAKVVKSTSVDIAQCEDASSPPDQKA